MMSGIVCNTGPLIALERVGLLHLFGPLFGHVLIPAAVEREFLAGQPVGTSFFKPGRPDRSKSRPWRFRWIRC